MERDILLSKILPPAVSTHYMRRSQLVKKLQQIHTSQALLLQSGAGYGKSSAVSHFLIDESVMFSWYHVTEDDDNIVPFLRYLYFSIQRVVPTFILSDSDWDTLSQFPSTEQLNKWYTLFTNAFHQVLAPLYIVLDDYHHVTHQFAIQYTMEKLIEFSPPHIRFIFITRTSPQLTVLRQLRRKGQLVLCEEADFLFTLEEMDVYLSDYFQLHLTEQQLQQTYALTDGWAMAVFLVGLRGKESLLPFEDVTKLSMQDAFEFLSDEVFGQCTAQEQQALLQYGILRQFDRSMLQQIYGEQALESFEPLVTTYQFIQLLEQETYTMHRLMQRFLEEKWREIDVAAWRTAHAQAATYFLQREQLFDAFYHLKKAGHIETLEETLITYAAKLIEWGHYEWLLEQLKELGSSRYELDYVEGECQRLRAFYEKSKRCYEQCLAKAQQYEDGLFMLKATKGLAKIYLDTLQPALAKMYLTDALRIAEEIAIPHSEYEKLHHQYAENLVNLGMAFEAQQHIASMALRQEVVQRGNMDIRILLRRGQLIEARMLAEQRLVEEQSQQDAHRDTSLLLALLYAMLGEPYLADQAAFRGKQKSEQIASAFGMAVANIRAGHAALVQYPFDMRIALHRYEQAEHVIDTLHVARIKAECYMGLSIAYARSGEMERGIDVARKGLLETERVQDRWVSGLLFLALTINYVELEKWDEALAMADKAKTMFTACQDAFCGAVTAYWQAVIAMHSEDERLFNESYTQCLPILTERAYQFFFEKDSLFGPRSLLTTYELAHFAKQCGLDVPFMYERLEQGIQPLYVQLLGPMYAKSGQVLIEDKAWQREKAKELFVYLYSQRHRFVAKEELMEQLWPFADEEARQRDFKVAYNALLKWLQPTRTARAQPFYMLRKQNLYKLRTAPFIMSDVAYLDRSYQYAQQQQGTYRLECLQQLVLLYNGPFFQEGARSYWIEERRQFYEAYMTESYLELAQTYEAQKRYEQATHWAKQLVQIDSTYEPAYCVLMRIAFAQHNRAAIVKWFDLCKQQLHMQLQVEPMEQTVTLYESLLR